MALDLNTGKVKWVTRAMNYDAWNVNCIETITPGSTHAIGPGPGPNCPAPTGPDYDFGGAGPNLVSTGRVDIVGVGEKSGTYWALNPDNGLWSGIPRSVPVRRLAVSNGAPQPTAIVSMCRSPICLDVPYQLQPSGASVNSGSWAALDPATGKFLWQTATPGACSTSIPHVAPGCMALGPASVANDVVFAGSMDTNKTNPTMFALDAKTGTILWQYVAGSTVNAGPAIVGNSVYWGSGYKRFGSRPCSVPSI